MTIDKDRMLMGPHAWLRHEEATAKKQAELRAQGRFSCDVGIGPSLLAAYGGRAICVALMPLIEEMAEGMYLVNFDGKRVYVWRRKNSADVMVREEFVAWMGEDFVGKLDAIVREQAGGTT